ncbi:MAG TPA: hypothetical protein VIY86_06415, partial [Pirellulaceae bacterium]
IAIDIVIQYADEGENPSNDPNGAWLNFIFGAAATYWENYLPESGTYEVDVAWSTSEFAGEPNTLGKWVYDCCGDDNIYINANPSGNWFFDPSPFDHSEYDFNAQARSPDGNGGWSYQGGQWLYRDVDSNEQSDWFNGNVPSLMEIGFRGQAIDPVAANSLDLLSTVIHELGHNLGVNSSGGPWEARPEWVNGGSVTFVENSDEGHLAARTSLMCEGCGLTGTRRLPSAMDIMAVADDEDFSHIDLPRKDFVKPSGDWNTAASWLGNRVPDSDDWVSIRNGAGVTLSANSFANRLTVASGNSLATSDHALAIGDSATIAGGILSKGHLTVSPSGSFSAEHLYVNGDLFVEGGSVQVGTDLQIGVLAEMRGRGHVNAATLVNNGTIRAVGGTLTIDGLVTANFGGDNGQGLLDATAGSLNLTALLTPDFQGRAVVGSGQSIHQNIVWTLGNNGQLTLQGGLSPAIVSGEKMTVRGDISVSNIGTILAPVQMESTAAVQIPTGSTLRFAGATSFRGGSYSGGGTLIQRG